MRNAAVWTIMYWGAVFVVFRWLFNFNIFSGAHWHHIMHAQLSGFAGLTFGIVSIALIPIYISTVTIILRTGKPLITIPLPRIFAPKPAPAPEPAPVAPDPNVIVIAADPVNLPEGMPAEMRASYLRARRYGAQFPMPKPKPATPAPTNDADTTPAQMPGELPIPSNFDFEDDVAAPSFDTPVFNDISFDTPSDNANTAAPPTDDTADNSIAVIADYLTTAGRRFTVTDDVIICDDMAIAAHTDADFWVADDDNWFATGKTRPSPIAALHRAAGDGGRRAILYLGATNILDLDTLRAKWTDDGITVITDLNDIE